MLSYCLKCRKKRRCKHKCCKNKGNPMLLSKSTVCGSKELTFIKEKKVTIVQKKFETKSSFHVK